MNKLNTQWHSSGIGCASNETDRNNPAVDEKKAQLCQSIKAMEEVLETRLSSEKSKITLEFYTDTLKPLIEETAFFVRSMKRAVASDSREALESDSSYQRQFVVLKNTEIDVLAMENRVANMEPKYFTVLPRSCAQELLETWGKLEADFSDLYGFIHEKINELEKASPPMVQPNNMAEID